MSLFVYLRVDNALTASVDQTVKNQLAELTGHAQHGTNLNDRDAAASSALGEVIRRDGSVTQSTPPNLPPLLAGGRLAQVLAGRRVSWEAEVSELHGEWRLAAESVRTASGIAVVVAAASLNARDEALDRLARELLFGVPLALAVAIVGCYLVAASALRPVEQMRARAAAITASTREQRLPVPPSDDELSRLSLTLNDMLARLEAAFEHERRFVADASHELRTPLSLLRTELELALRRPRTRDELEQALRSAAEETERLSRLAEDLLLIARSDQGHLPIRARAVDANELLESTAARHRAAAVGQGRAIVVVTDGDVHLSGDRVRLEQALGNLVSNALIYGAGTVELSVEAREGEAVIHVMDRGVGFTTEFSPRAFDRFSRADEARVAGGAGLGLAIVQLIAEAHGGSVGLANRVGGGADVWLAVPRVKPTATLSSSGSHLRAAP